MLKATVEALAFGAALLAVPASAGTLTIDWVGGPQTYQGDLGNGVDETIIGPPYEASFVFSVPYLTPSRFTYSGVIDPSTNTEFAVHNPYGATLISRPDGHLGGYSEGNYAVTVVPAGVKLSAWFSDLDDQMSMDSKSIFEDHNQGLFFNWSSGYWTASYVAASSEDGESFEVLAPIPLPASLPLLALAVGAVGLAASKRSRSRAGAVD